MKPGYDGIDVSSGSTTTVETDDLFLAAATLSTLAANARDWSQQAAMARCITQWSGDAAPFGFAESDLARSSAVLQDTADGAERLGVLLEEAATAYADGERRTADGATLLTALGALVAGGFTRHMILGALPLAPTAAVALLVAQHPEVRRLAAIAGQPLLAELAERSDLLASPALVDLVRALVSSADDFALGLAGVDPPLARLLGDEGAGVVGLSGMAGALLVLAGRNAYTATPVNLTGGEPVSVPAPATLADAASRIPPSTPGHPQIRIERFTDPSGEATYAVYLAGTSDLSTGGDEPFDMASNLAGIAGNDAASYRAALDAMDAAGIGAGDRVTLVGHSQGGLVAARIAASGAYATEALVTFGAPTGQISVPDGVAHVAVEHAEDITPALGGMPLDGDDGRDRIVVTRSLFDDAPRPDGAVIAAHHMARYAETAALVDRADDPRLDAMRSAIAGLGTGSAGGTATLYRADRVRG